MTILPFLGSNRKKAQSNGARSKRVQRTGERPIYFSDAAIGKVLKDYFDLSSKVKEMHTEIFSLRDQLAQAAALQCINKECAQRSAAEA